MGPFALMASLTWGQSGSPTLRTSLVTVVRSSFSPSWSQVVSPFSSPEFPATRIG